LTAIVERYMAKLAKLIASTPGRLPSGRGNKSIAAELKELRSSLDMSQREFAETFGLPLSSLQTWESPAKNGNPDLAARLLIDMIKADAATVAALVRKTKIQRLQEQEVEYA
jgi:putative transcriptional regulator